MPSQSTVTSKKINSKPHKIGKKSPAPSGKSNGGDRVSMISEAAYYRALGRGFEGGDQVEDWLMAEAELEGMPPDWEDTDRHLATVD